MESSVQDKVRQEAHAVGFGGRRERSPEALRMWVGKASKQDELLGPQAVRPKNEHHFICFIKQTPSPSLPAGTLPLVNLKPF